MTIRTLSLTVPASRDVVYRFLADVENFPKWAAGYCESIELHRRGWLAYTSQGEMVVELEADDRTGVIDLRVGPSADKFRLFPLRVWSLSNEKTAVSFTLIQTAELSDEQYETQYRSWCDEMDGLIRRFGGGELHAPEAVTGLSVFGVN